LDGVAHRNDSAGASRARLAAAAFLLAACARERTPGAQPGTILPRSVQQTEQQALGAAPGVPDGPYALDRINRKLTSGPLRCPAVDAHDFAGTRMRFVPAAKVVAPFRERLLLLEQVAGDVGLRVYGRAPSRLHVAASYDCRPVTGNGGRLSEHALANAIDITAFDFPAVYAVGPKRSAADLALAGELEVRVDRHWKAKGDPLVERHARFLSELTDELDARRIFRTLLGPAHPDHKDHFHFDMAPHRYVKL
jgi:extensin-like protein